MFCQWFVILWLLFEAGFNSANDIPTGEQYGVTLQAAKSFAATFLVKHIQDPKNSAMQVWLDIVRVFQMCWDNCQVRLSKIGGATKSLVLTADSTRFSNLAEIFPETSELEDCHSDVVLWHDIVLKIKTDCHRNGGDESSSSLSLAAGMIFSVLSDVHACKLACSLLKNMLLLASSSHGVTGDDGDINTTVGRVIADKDELSRRVSTNERFDPILKQLFCVVLGPAKEMVAAWAPQVSEPSKAKFDAALLLGFEADSFAPSNGNWIMAVQEQKVDLRARKDIHLQVAKALGLGDTYIAHTEWVYALNELRRHMAWVCKAAVVDNTASLDKLVDDLQLRMSEIRTLFSTDWGDLEQAAGGDSKVGADIQHRLASLKKDMKEFVNTCAAFKLDQTFADRCSGAVKALEAFKQVRSSHYLFGSRSRHGMRTSNNSSCLVISKSGLKETNLIAWQPEQRSMLEISVAKKSLAAMHGQFSLAQ